jgi:predicted ABC-type exoprotein transport system permease subunit
MITALTIAIVLAVLGLVLGALGQRRLRAGSLLGGASTILICLAILTPMVRPEGRYTSIAQWVLLIAAMALTAVDFWLMWKRWRKTGSVI